MKLSLLSFNTFGVPFFSPDVKGRYKRAAEIIEQSNTDIVCLQEISTYYHFSVIKKYLKSYPYVVKHNNIWGPRGGLVIASKVPIEEITYTNFRALGTFRDASFYTRLNKNGLLTVKVKNHDLYIVNTHTVTDFEFEWSPQNKLYQHVKGQVLEITEMIKKLSHQEKNIIVTGDFNIKKNSQLYKSFLTETNAMDLFGKEIEPTYFHDRDSRFPGKTSERIDFMFYIKGKKKLTPLTRTHLFEKEEILSNGKKSYLSDHIGLKIDFDIV